MKRFTPSQFKVARKAIAASLDETAEPLSLDEMAAALFLSDGRSVRRFENGTRTPEGPTHAAYALMLEFGLLPEVAKAIRERRAKDGRRKKCQ